jgi:hypothetical protein
MWSNGILLLGLVGGNLKRSKQGILNLPKLIHYRMQLPNRFSLVDAIRIAFIIMLHFHVVQRVNMKLENLVQEVACFQMYYLKQVLYFLWFSFSVILGFPWYGW